MENKKLILDYSKWRCGGNKKGDHKLGEGNTQLLNEEGYMCCLGQFSLQLDPQLKRSEILDKGTPEDILDREIPLLSFYNEDEDALNRSNTLLTDEAISINDDLLTTPDEKIEKLRELFAPEGYEIEVINKI